MPVRLHCKECDNEFDEIHHKETVKEGVFRWYYECPQCKYQATICYIDGHIRFQQHLQEKARQAGNWKEHEKITEKIEKMMKTLKEKYEPTK